MYPWTPGRRVLCSFFHPSKVLTWRISGFCPYRSSRLAAFCGLHCAMKLRNPFKDSPFWKTSCALASTAPQTSSRCCFFKAAYSSFDNCCSGSAWFSSPVCKYCDKSIASPSFLFSFPLLRAPIVSTASVFPAPFPLCLLFFFDLI